MGRLAVVAAALLLGTARCGACEPDKPPPPAPSASASSAASTARPPPIASHVPRPPPQPKLACRVIAVDGEAHVENAVGDAGTTPLLLQGLAPVDAWIALGKGSRVIARDPRTTRETTFRGPARARACVGFSEESWLASGTFESAVGAGEAPGNEEWVVTPSGIVRYTSAGLSLEAKPHEADVTLTSGVAFAWQPSAPGADAAAPPGDAGTLEEGWLRLPMGKTRLGVGHDETASGALDRCVALSASAKDLAGQVMAPGGASASLITQQVTTRRLARAACAVATLRVNALPPADATPLLRPLADANMAWSGQPTATP
ncbi:MAG: hypothetical protein ABSE49_10710 [Polyangiaceae bacterium]|jgi:hypothetical protein